jgi:hypothetical protein
MDIVVCPGNGYYHHRYTQDTLITNKLFSKIENAIKNSKAILDYGAINPNATISK